MEGSNKYISTPQLDTTPSNQSWEKSQAPQARLRNQMRWIEEPFWDEFTHKMLQIDKMALWGKK